MSEGYLHPFYAESLSEFGTPIYLPNSKGWLIKRQIPDTPYFDAMGSYPLFFCKEWDKLIADLELLKEELVCISMVICPFVNFPEDNFKDYFEEFYRYKHQYILDTTLPMDQVISCWHRRSARRALKKVKVDLAISPNIDVEEWHHLYSCLIKHHNITDIRTFSLKCFEKQLAIPNTYLFRVIYEDLVVGGQIFYMQSDIAYSHLSAFTIKGYELHAGYAVQWSAIEYLSNQIRWINFGGGHAKIDGELDTLSQFKKGWASSSKFSHFCGKVLNLKKYNEILHMKNINSADWFPAYRSGEFS